MTPLEGQPLLPSYLPGFKMVFDEAVLVLAKTIPIDMLENEMRQVDFHRLVYPEQITAIKAESRKTYMHKWQSWWENSLRGRWTFHLAPYIH